MSSPIPDEFNADLVSVGAELAALGDRCRFTGYLYALADVTDAVADVAGMGGTVNARAVLDIIEGLGEQARRNKDDDGGHVLPAR